MTESTKETDPELVEMLREAGRKWGPLGVALAAAGLTDSEVLIKNLSGETRPARSEEPERSWEEELGFDRNDPQHVLAADLAAASSDLIVALRTERYRQGLTTEEMAERLGVSPETVADFERLGGDPRLSTIRRYALGLGVRVSHRVGDEPESEPEPVESMWLNGFSCVRPSDEFAAGIGHSVVRLLKESGPREGESVWRRVRIDVTAS